MRTVIWILVPVVVGVAILAFVTFRSGRDNRPGSMEDEMRQFRRGLDALDPANDPLRRRQLAEQAQRRSEEPTD
jgi:hypothetical protein